MFEEIDSSNFDSSKSREKGYLVIKKGKLRYYNDQYVIFIYPFSLLILSFLGIIGFFQGKNVSNSFWLFEIFLFVLSLSWLYFSIRGIKLGRKLIVFNMGKNKEYIRLVVANVINSLGWHIIKNNENFLVALINPRSFAWSWGQIIIILYEKGNIYICCNNRTGFIGKLPIFPCTHKKRIKEFADALNKAM